MTLNLHDLDDSEAGQPLTGFPYALTPGSSVFVTETAAINVTGQHRHLDRLQCRRIGNMQHTERAHSDNNPTGISDSIDAVVNGTISDPNVYINTTTPGLAI